jgi:hypothetical protein
MESIGLEGKIVQHMTKHEIEIYISSENNNLKNAISWLVKTGNPHYVFEHAILQYTLNNVFVIAAKPGIYIVKHLLSNYNKIQCTVCGNSMKIWNFWDCCYPNGKLNKICKQCINYIVAFSEEQVIQIGKNRIKVLFLLKQIFPSDIAKLIIFH